MFRRRPLRRGPGLLGTMARTAVVAGTATAVSRGVTGAMAGRAQEHQQEEQAGMAALQSQGQIADLQAQLAAMQAQQARAAANIAPAPGLGPPPSAAPAVGGDLMAQLLQLAQLKDAGGLTDAEFTAAKAKLLGP